MTKTSIVVLTGAGISAESGLGTFRSRDGIWAKYNLNRVATPEAFAAEPGMVHDFYNLRRRACLDARPNAAHFALARLQAEWLGGLKLITQNVDDLHERAGSVGVLHMHGQLRRALCAACGHRWPAPELMSPQDACPACQQKTTRPDVVWFGEATYHLPEITEQARRANIFVVIGSSGQVYPAAELAGIARENGAHVVEINLEPTRGPFHTGVYGNASEVLPGWVEKILAEQLNGVALGQMG